MTEHNLKLKQATRLKVLEILGTTEPKALLTDKQLEALRRAASDGIISTEDVESLSLLVVKINSLKKDSLSQEDKYLGNFISATSFLLPHQYAEAFKGDLLEKKSDMIKSGHTLRYVWLVLIVNIGYTFWAAAWFKLKDIVSPQNQKEINKD